MNDPQINVDHFYHRPTYHVVGLLTEHAEIPAISRELKSAGVDVAAVEILCGERGAAILDEHGRYHGLAARVVRAFQLLGYDEETLERFDEALRHGDLLLRVPAFVVTAVRLSRRESNVYQRFRQQLGRAILLGLELLVAADIIRTVAASPNLTSVAILAAIVLIRTFLSFSLEVETTGRWPWQKRDISAS
jgi:uncharacterized membrane protein